MPSYGFCKIPNPSMACFIGSSLLVEIPEDLVANKVTEKLKHYKKFPRIDTLEKKYNDSNFADKWLSYGIDRKICKKPVMCLPYSLTQYSCRQYLQDHVEKEFKEQRKFGQKEIIKLLIEIKEDIERSTENMDSNTDVYKGMLLISNNIDTMLKEQGVEKIESIGKQFDPKLHQAVSSKEDAKLEENTISSEIRKGYKIHGVLLKPSLVEIIKNDKEKDE